MSHAVSTDDFEVIDCHIHLFSTLDRCNKLNWLDQGHVLYRPHSYQDYLSSPSRASSAIFVECDTVVEEDYAAHFEEFRDASAAKGIRAIVAWAPMNDLNVFQQYLATIQAMDTRNLLRGVRVLLQDKPDGYCTESDFLRCIKHLGIAELLFEIGIDVRSRGKRQLEDALKLIECCPETTFVLNHLAKPDLSTSISAYYSEYMKRIAKYQNVSMKLSGGLTQLDEGDKLPNETLASYINLNLALFGTDRLLFGSDWPVLTLSPAAPTTEKTPDGWFRFCKETLQDLGVQPSDMQKIFAGNARRIYKLT